MLREHYKRGRPLPKKFQDCPTLHDGLQFTYAAFMELSTCRPYTGMGVGPIPWTATVEYGRMYGLSGGDLQDFIYYIQSMDKEYMEHVQKKQESSSKSGKPSGGAGKGKGRIGGRKA